MARIESKRDVCCHPRLLIFLVICCFLSAVLAVPATRSLKSIKVYSSIQGTVAEPQFQLWKRRSIVESNFEEGRMDIELNDYPGPGANTGHQPPVTPTKP